MPNELASASSLYLRQHANQPVNWRPWGEAAFAAAEAEDKPMLISIGYSACHWCHVMAREAFSDALCADLMNRHFICVKIDREERPDLDQVYMEAIQMLDQPAGWPLNAFCLPDGRPFYGGTYFPARDDNSGIIPWPQVLMRVADFYKRQRSELAENAHAIQQNMLAGNQPDNGGQAWQPTQLLTAARGILGNNDSRYGGFGKAPKFPNASADRFLLAVRQSNAVRNDAQLSRNIDDAVHLHLRAMAHGGIFEQIGGGFARYSTDDYWLIPHFEKMLYDNALLISAYTRAARHYGEPLFLKVAEETVAWLHREMALESGGFAASLSAETTEGEGRFYLWTPEEIAEVLGSERGSRFAQVYNITESGNFRNRRSNPALTEADPAVRDDLAKDRAKLLEARKKRPQPARDTKRVTAWNALAAQAFAELWMTTGHRSHLETARRTLDFLWQTASDQDHKNLRVNAVTYLDGASSGEGFLTDYAHLGDACLTTATALALAGETDAAAEFRSRAVACGHTLFNRFGDEAAGFFFTANDYPTAVARRKDWIDSGVPAGNSAALHLMVGLDALEPTGPFGDAVNRTLPAYLPFSERIALGTAEALTAAAERAAGVPIIHHGVRAPVSELRQALATKPYRRFHLLSANQQTPEGDRAFTLCVNNRCLPPTNDPIELAEFL